MELLHVENCMILASTGGHSKSLILVPVESA